MMDTDTKKELCFERGQFISANELAEHFNVPVQSQQLDMLTLSLRDQLERKEGLLSRIERRGLRILTHDGASDYVYSRMLIAVRSVVKQQNRLKLIDRSQVRDKQGHDSRSYAISRMAEAVKREQREQEKIERISKELGSKRA